MAQSPARLDHQLSDFARHRERFILRIGFSDGDHTVPVSSLGAQGARRAARLGRREQSLGRFEHLRRTSMAFLEGVGGASVRLRKVRSENSGQRAAESVDRLVGVARHDEVRSGFGGRDEAQQVELGRVDVLKLIDEDVSESAPQLLQQVGVRREQADRVCNEVPEIDHARFGESRLVVRHDGGQRLEPLASRRLGRERQRRGMHEVLFHESHETERVLSEGVRAPHRFEFAQ